MISCPVCSAGSSLEHSFSDVYLYRCQDCDHCFTDTEALDAVEIYDDEYFKEDHERWFNNPDLAVYRRLNNFIRGHKANASLLDVGCGNGNFLSYLKYENPGLSLTGIDYALNEPSEGIEFLQGDFLEKDFGRQYDFIVTMMTIEHVADVQLFMKRLCELCVDNGFVIIMTINDRSFLYQVARLLMRLSYKEPFMQLYSKHHLNHFNFNSLRKLAECHRLKVAKTLRHNIPLAAVDIPVSSRFPAAILRIGVWCVFMLCRITGRTYIQTLICQKKRPAS